MKTKKLIPLALLSILILLSGFILSRGPRPEMRRPGNVIAAAALRPSFLIRKNFLAAQLSAENLDEQSAPLLEFSALNFAQRWSQGVSLSRLEKDYDREMLRHVTAMTALLKARREMGAFKKLQEFDFQNLLRKSDYLLALPVTRVRLESLQRNSGESKTWETLIQNYQRERKALAGEKNWAGFIQPQKPT